MGGRACSFLCFTLSYGDGLGRTGDGEIGAPLTTTVISQASLLCGVGGGMG